MARNQMVSQDCRHSYGSMADNAETCSKYTAEHRDPNTVMPIRISMCEISTPVLITIQLAQLVRMHGSAIFDRRQ